MWGGHEHERNINEITCDTSFQSPIKKKYVSTINDYVYYESDEQVDKISDSNKKVDPRSDPMAETHIVDRIRKLSVRVGLFEPSIIGVIGKDLVKNVQENFGHGDLSQLLVSAKHEYAEGECDWLGMQQSGG